MARTRGTTLLDVGGTAYEVDAAALDEAVAIVGEHGLDDEASEAALDALAETAYDWEQGGSAGWGLDTEALADKIGVMAEAGWVHA
jgi:hypothetical protein